MWEIIYEERRTEDNIEYTAYGVRCGSFCIADLCADRREIFWFAKVLNEYGVSPVNAADIAEDYLAGGFEALASTELPVTA
ncbi:MAG: hypothetical protein J6A19_11490 [Oscillospiraceae bacterium]|nr:hypothetical protein [Oscillospiraceae bacterium]